MSSFIQVASGRSIDPLNPSPEDISIDDIAHALSNMCRFAGHTREFYSVAEHSIRVSCYGAQDDAFEKLMHDASEAYLVDIPRPIKHDLFGDRYREIEENLMRCIGEKFGFDPTMTASIKEADDALLAMEARDLMDAERNQDLWGPWIKEALKNAPVGRITSPLSPDEARKAFLARYESLKEENGEDSK